MIYKGNLILKTMVFENVNNSQYFQSYKRLYQILRKNYL